MNLSRVGFNDDSILDERQLYEGQLLPLASSTPQKSRKRTESLSQLHPHLTYDEAKRPEFEDDRQRNLQQGDARISSLSRSGVTPPGATASDRVSSVKRDENISDERTLWPSHAIDTPTKYRERLARLSSRPQRVTNGAAKWPEVADTTALSQIEFPQEKEIDELIETHPDRISKQKPLTPVGPIPWENILRKQDSSYKFPSVDLSWSQMLLSDDEIPSGRRKRRRSHEPSIVHDSLTPRRLSDISYVYQEPHLDLINVSPAIDELFRDVTPSRPGEPPPGDTASLSPVKYDENESVIEEEIDRLDEMRSVIEKEIDILDEKRSVTEEEIDRLDEMRSAAEEEIDRLDEIRNATEEEIDKLDEIRSAIGKETYRLDEMRGATEEEIERADEKRSVTEEVIDGLDEMRSVTEEIDGLDEKRSVTEEEIDRLDEIRNAIGTEIERLDEIRGFTEEELERLDGMRSVTEEEIDRLDEMRSVIETQTEKTDDRISPQRHHKYLSETLPALQRSPLRITPDYPLSRTLPIVKISEFSDPYRPATRASIPPKSQMSPRYRQPQEILLRTSTDASVSPVSSEEPSLLSDDLIDQSLSPFSKISDISLILSEPSVNVPYEDSESIVPGVFPENIPNILEAYEEKDSESVLRDIFALPPISDEFQEEDAKDEGSSHYESWEEFPEEEYITSIPEESKQNTERVLQAIADLSSIEGDSENAVFASQITKPSPLDLGVKQLFSKLRSFIAYKLSIGEDPNAELPEEEDTRGIYLAVKNLHERMHAEDRLQSNLAKPEVGEKETSPVRVRKPRVTKPKVPKTKGPKVKLIMPSPVKEPEPTTARVRKPRVPKPRVPKSSPVRVPELSPVREPEPTTARVRKPRVPKPRVPKPSPVRVPELSPVREPEPTTARVRKPRVPKPRVPKPSPVREPEPSPVRGPEPAPVRVRKPRVTKPRVPKSRVREVSPAREPELSPVRELEPSPVRKPEPAPVRVRKPRVTKPRVPKSRVREVSPVREPELSPVREPELSLVREAEPAPVRVRMPRVTRPRVPKPKVGRPRIRSVSPDTLHLLLQLGSPESRVHEVSPAREPELLLDRPPELSLVRAPEPTTARVRKIRVPRPRVPKPSPFREPGISPVILPESSPDIVPMPRVRKPRVSRPRVPKPSPVREPGISPVILPEPSPDIVLMPRVRKPRVSRPRVPKPSPVREAELSPVILPEPSPDIVPMPRVRKPRVSRPRVPKPSTVREPEPSSGSDPSLPVRVRKPRVRRLTVQNPRIPRPSPIRAQMPPLEYESTLRWTRPSRKSLATIFASESDSSPPSPNLRIRPGENE